MDFSSCACLSSLSFSFSLSLHNDGEREEKEENPTTLIESYLSGYIGDYHSRFCHWNVANEEKIIV